jgi:hypothetical protein
MIKCGVFSGNRQLDRAAEGVVGSRREAHLQPFLESLTPPTSGNSNKKMYSLNCWFNCVAILLI